MDDINNLAVSKAVLLLTVVLVFKLLLLVYSNYSTYSSYKLYLGKVDLSILTTPSGIKQKPPLLDIQLCLLDFLPWQSLDNKTFYE